MSKERVIVLSVVQQHLSKAETARRYGMSWRWVHILVTRYHDGGLEAVEPRSRRPGSHPRALDDDLRTAIIDLRTEPSQREGQPRPPICLPSTTHHRDRRRTSELTSST